MTRSKMRILVVDDEPKYVRAIKINLEARGYQVVTATNGKSAIEVAVREDPDLFILDLRMPDMDGYQVCERIREFSVAPVIMLTALTETANKIKGLDMGADDYVTKPFSVDELLARVRAALRRVESSNRTPPESIRQVGGLYVDLAQQRAFVDDKEIDLTSTEYRLLCELIKQPGYVLTSDYLLEKVWGATYQGGDNIVWKAIHRLRRKIEADPRNPRYIHNKPGIGYVLNLDE